MNRQSPTPWTVRAGDYFNVLEVWDSRRELVCKVFGHTKSLGEMREDARLIAAAPEMLEMLQEIVMSSSMTDLQGPWLRKAENFIDYIAKPVSISGFATSCDGEAD